MSNEELLDWKNRGDELVKNQQYEEAIVCYQQALLIDPDNSALWNNMGFAYKNLGREADVNKCKNKIIEIKNKERIIQETQSPNDQPISFSTDNGRNNLEINHSDDVHDFKYSNPIKQIQFKDSFKKVSKNVTEKSLGFVSSLKETVKTKVRENSYKNTKRDHIIHIKKLIIAEFSLKELKNMSLYYRIGEPTIPRINRDNELVFVTPTRADWSKYALNKIELTKLKEYARMHNHLPYKIVELEETYKKQRMEQYPEYEKDDSIPLSERDLGSCDVELLQELINVIKEYRPIKPFRNEILYHTNLYTFLCEKISNEIKFEEQRGSSRPDIVVDNIAIEIKGPTDRGGLITIADKINRYSQFFDHIIVVLFEVEVFERFYYEWYDGIMKQYENQVTIIRK